LLCSFWTFRSLLIIKIMYPLEKARHGGTLAESKA
jgi:hypothetical protein